MKLSRVNYIFLLITAVACCRPANIEPDEVQLPAFTSEPTVFSLAEGLLNDASGITDAVKFENSVWVHNDHDPHLYLVSYEGQLLKKFPLDVYVRDWEDIASGPGPESNVNYIYIAETGDNDEVFPEYYIYRFPEPGQNQDRIDHFETIPFKYPEGKSYDVETLLLDPHTRDLYLVTKRQLTQAHVFRLPYPQKTGESNIAELVTSIPYGMLTSGSISPDGKEILLKSYTNIFYWKVREGESIPAALSRPHDMLPPYILEPQGEAIAFDKNAGGYFTISEKGSSPGPVKLYYYRKIKD